MQHPYVMPNSHLPGAHLEIAVPVGTAEGDQSLEGAHVQPRRFGRASLLGPQPQAGPFGDAQQLLSPMITFR